MSRHPLMLIRTVDDVEALVSVLREDNPISAKIGASLDVDPWEEQRCSLEHCTDWNREYLTEIRDAWKRLGNVEQWDGQLASDIELVLCNTIPDESPTIDPWRPQPPPEPPRRSAANPRAFRGTKFQPPSPPKVEPVDLRPHLLNRRDTSSIAQHLHREGLLSLASFFRPTLFEVSLFDSDLLASLKREGLFNIESAEKYLARIRSNFSTFNLVSSLKPTLGAIALYRPDLLGRATGLVWQLGLENNSDLHRIFNRLLSGFNFPTSIEWAELALELPVNRRKFFLATLIQWNIPGRSPKAFAESIRKASAISSDTCFADRIWTIVERIKYDEPLEPLLQGFKLANDFNPKFEFCNKELDPDCPVDAIREWAEIVATPNDNWDRSVMATSLWEDCGTLGGLSKMIKGRPWQSLNPNLAYEILRPLTDRRFADTSEEMNRSFEIVKSRFATFRQIVLQLPVDYRAKGVELFRRTVNEWEGKHLERAADAMLQLLPNVCREPLDVAPKASQLYCAMFELQGEELERWLKDCSSQLEKFEKAAKRSNDANLMDAGLGSFARHHGTPLLDALEASVPITLRACYLLGCLSKSDRVEVLATAMNHPLQQEPGHAGTDLKELVNWIETNLPDGVSNPVSRKARQYAGGELSLTPGQIEREIRQTIDGLGLTRIDLIRAAAREHMAAKLGLEPQAAQQEMERHALEMQTQASDNRRAFRKFLRAYFAGEHEYLQKHPANLKWLAEHPKIDPDRWSAGIEHVGELDGKTIRLTLETNPLEALRLGTYVGSCLGVGGMMAVSAAAVVMDINKAVVYARDERGTVIARQLLAISESDQLIPFHVYPNSASEEILKLFAQYDLKFAESLGIDVYESDGEDFVVAKPISSYWWDDMPWDMAEVEVDSTKKDLPKNIGWPKDAQPAL